MKGVDVLLISYIIYFLRSIFILAGNLLKKGLRPPDYVVFTLHGSYPDLPQPPEGILKHLTRPRIKSLTELEREFMLVAENSRVKGIILHLGSLSLSMAGIQSLRQMIKDLQNKGKEVITWATNYDTYSYYLATAGNRILLQKGGVIYTLGFAHRQLYMKKTLDWCGIELDVVRVSPYKSSLDGFIRSDMSGEVREMTNWLMDSYYQQFIRDISRDRGLEENQAHALIKQTPLFGEKAINTGAVDGVVNAEDLTEFLKVKRKSIRLANWDECKKTFSRPLPPPPGEYIAILRVEGNIIDGKSRRPPAQPPLPIPFLFNAQTGDLTFVQQARLVLRNRRVRAVLLYIDSGGGSAASSEAITSILQKIAAQKPLVALMGSIAGSGGYYVATPASYIVAQPATITGSIGVIAARIVNSHLLEKLLLNRETIRRGQKDLFASPEDPFTEQEREKAGEFINQIYDLFIKHVGESRSMSPEAVDRIGSGRVWTGEQALEHGLVDEMGGLKTALSKLRTLADLPQNIPLIEIPYPRRDLAPIQNATTAWIDHALDNLAQVQKSQALLAGPPYFYQPFNREAKFHL